MNRHSTRRGIVDLTLLVLMPMTCMMLDHYVLGFKAEQSLIRQIEECRKAGEPMLAADLASPSLPDADNAALALRAAARAIDSQAVSWHWYNNTDLPTPLTEPVLQQLALVLKDQENALRKVEAATIKTGFDWQIKYKSPLVDILLPDLQEQRHLGILLRAAALYAHQTADDGEAVERVLQMLFISRGVRTQPFVVSYLVSLGIANLATDMAIEMAPDLIIATGELEQEALATPQQVKTLIDQLLNDQADLESLRWGLRFERVALLEMFRKPSTRWLREPAISAAQQMMTHMAAVLARLDAPDWPSCQQALPAAPRPPRMSTLLQDPAETLMMLDCGPILHRRYRKLTTQRLAATSLAIRWYAAEHTGELPQSLQDLVPQYLPAVPADPMAANGRPLVYRPAANPPILYSVGDNGIDDGGSAAALVPNKDPGNRWNQKDFVIPVKRSAVQAEAR